MKLMKPRVIVYNAMQNIFREVYVHIFEIHMYLWKLGWSFAYMDNYPSQKPACEH